jgi:hypothetical protein
MLNSGFSSLSMSIDIEVFPLGFGNGRSGPLCFRQ